MTVSAEVGRQLREPGVTEHAQPARHPRRAVLQRGRAVEERHHLRLEAVPLEQRGVLGEAGEVPRPAVAARAARPRPRGRRAARSRRWRRCRARPARRRAARRAGAARRGRAAPPQGASSSAAPRWRRRRRRAPPARPPRAPHRHPRAKSSVGWSTPAGNCARAASIIAASLSRPVTEVPRSAIAAASRPVPQPRSRMRSPRLRVEQHDEVSGVVRDEAEALVVGARVPARAAHRRAARGAR